jgi:hypothetical protein
MDTSAGRPVSDLNQATHHIDTACALTTYVPGCGVSSKLQVAPILLGHLCLAGS